eukprot:gene11684-11773_t
MLKTNGDDYIEELGHFSMKYDAETKVLLKSAEYAIRECKGDMTKAAESYVDYLEKYLLSELRVPGTEIKSRIEALSSEVVKDFLYKIGKNTSEIEVLGYHGQTMYHQPDQKVLMSQLAVKRTSGAESMDEGGKYGSRGKVDETAFKALWEKSILKDGKNYLLICMPNFGGLYSAYRR